jgi:hypothetical protein
MPIEASSKIIKEMLPWTELKVYERAGHGRPYTVSVMTQLLTFA